MIDPKLDDFLEYLFYREISQKCDMSPNLWSATCSGSINYFNNHFGGKPLAFCQIHSPGINFSRLTHEEYLILLVLNS